MRGSVFLLLLLAAAPTVAAEGPSQAPGGRGHPSGIVSHGDAGDLVEDAYARPPERAPPEDAARRKHDPALPREGPATGR